jgi:hypothetical protein
MITYEYPFITDEVIDGLNLLNRHCVLIIEIWQQITNYIEIRFKMQR